MNTDRRRGKRFSAQFGVVFHDGEELNFSFITDMSRSGAYLSSKRLFPVGSPLLMRISNGEIDVAIPGKVVRVENGHQENDDSERIGMGVRFDFLSPVAKRLRDDLLLYLMSVKYHHQWTRQNQMVS